MATSAAPTYFSPCGGERFALHRRRIVRQLSRSSSLARGAFAFFRQDENDVYVLSVGTTTSQFSFAQTSARSLGIAQWFRNARLLNVIIASQQRSTDFMMQHRLGDRYLRLDAEQSKEQERRIGPRCSDVRRSNDDQSCRAGHIPKRHQRRHSEKHASSRSPITAIFPLAKEQ